MEVGLKGEVYQRWTDVVSEPRSDGSQMSESLSDPSVEEQMDGWVDSLEEVEQSWKGRKRADVSGAEQDAQSSMRRRWYSAIWYPVI